MHIHQFAQLVRSPSAFYYFYVKVSHVAHGTPDIVAKLRAVLQSKVAFC